MQAGGGGASFVSGKRTRIEIGMRRADMHAEAGASDNDFAD
jgi:hypothetical protein